jgi:hypothetical protein
MTADDAFWGARLVSKFSSEAIRAVVAKARYSEPGAADHIANTLIKRRDKVLRAWLTGVNPLLNARLSNDGVLTFENAAVDVGLVKPPTEYRFTWSRFDNATGSAAAGSEGGNQAPKSLLDSPFIRVSVRTIHPDYPAWSAPVTFTFRRTNAGWENVGLDRTERPVVKK